MLDQVMMPRSLHPHLVPDLSHASKLVVTGKDEFSFFNEYFNWRMRERRYSRQSSRLILEKIRNPVEASGMLAM